MRLELEERMGLVIASVVFVCPLQPQNTEEGKAGSRPIAIRMA